MTLCQPTDCVVHSEVCLSAYKIYIWSFIVVATLYDEISKF